MPPRPGSASVRSANQVCSSLHLSNLVVSSTTYSTQAIRQVRIKQQKQTVRPDATNIMCSSLKKPSIRRVLLSSTGRIFTSGCSRSALDTLKHLELLLTPDNTPRAVSHESSFPQRDGTNITSHFPVGFNQPQAGKLALFSPS